jgi:hypothetical protein
MVDVRNIIEQHMVFVQQKINQPFLVSFFSFELSEKMQLINILLI